MSVEDAVLVERCLQGNEEGLRSLVQRYQGAVFGLCFRMLGHREDAEDVAQDVFVRMYRSLHRWDATRPFRPWLLTIAANRCRTALEKRSRRPRPTEIVEHIAETSSPQTELAEELQQALSLLREEYRECVILFHHQELSLIEVADIMGSPPGTVKTWLHRARKELAEHLQRRGVAPHACHELP